MEARFFFLWNQEFDFTYEEWISSCLAKPYLLLRQPQASFSSPRLEAHFPPSGCRQGLDTKG